jgi:hypothetical protein
VRHQRAGAGAGGGGDHRASLGVRAAHPPHSVPPLWLCRIGALPAPAAAAPPARLSLISRCGLQTRRNGLAGAGACPEAHARVAEGGGGAPYLKLDVDGEELQRGAKEDRGVDEDSRHLRAGLGGGEELLSSSPRRTDRR